MQDYRHAQVISCSPAKCFYALTHQIDQWWSTRVEGKGDTISSEFTVYFDKTFKKMQVVELVENRKVLWRCVDSYLDLDSLQNKSEWNGTTIEWTICADGNDSVLAVRHQGLNPSIECYDACEQGWNHFFTNSLVTLLENNQGHPYKG